MIKKSYTIIKNNKKYILTALSLFVVGIVLGVVASEQLMTLVNEQLQKIEGLAKDIAERGSVWYAFWIIFTNNTQAAAAFIILGSVFAIVPIFGLLANGILVGIVLGMVAESGVSVWQVLLIGIIPHGILELPAIFIAGALGIRLGTVWLETPTSSSSRWQNYKDTWLDVGGLTPMLILLLLVAAVIESFITPVLIHLFIGEV